MTYACPAWELATDTYFLKPKRLKNKVPLTIEHFPRFTSARDLHMTFNFPYIYDYITNLCRRQAEVIKIMRMNMFVL
jgi:hypothetical protein